MIIGIMENNFHIYLTWNCEKIRAEVFQASMNTVRVRSFKSNIKELTLVCTIYIA